MKGINVEVYVEDVKANTMSNGIYSLFKDEWIKKPSKESIEIEKNRITITIPFNKIGVNAFNIVSDKVYNKVTNKTEDMILDLIRYNPNITISQFVIKINIQNRE